MPPWLTVLKLEEATRARLYKSTSTFKYYNAKGETLWQKDKFTFNSLYNSSNILSGDGKRIFFVSTRKVFEDSEDKCYYRAMILDEKGATIWDIGEYTDISDIKITKNGKYGLFRYEKHKENEEAALFLDIENKKTSTTKEIGYFNIAEDGKAQVSEILSWIEINSSGVIRYWGEDRKLKFEKPFSSLNKDELSLISKDESERIKQIIIAKSEDSILRTKIIYVYQFK